MASVRRPRKRPAARCPTTEAFVGVLFSPLNDERKKGGAVARSRLKAQTEAKGYCVTLISSMYQPGYATTEEAMKWKEMFTVLPT